MRLAKVLFGIVAVLVVVLAGLRLTHPLPSLPGGPATTAIPAGPETRLGAALLPLAQVHPGLSGVVPLVDGRDALAARVLLARAAEVSIDVQYYIWQTDTTGWLLLDELRAAADRGVRVRLLLDDNGIPGLDNVLADLDAMETVEVRLFNPFTLRRPKLLSYGFDFFRLNRRMHNKSMTADGIATVIGGRNIGDIYFAYGEGTAYFDFDVLAVGPAAADVAADFDRYWSSGSAYAAADILPRPRAGIAELARAAEVARRSVGGSAYLAAVAEAPVVGRVLAGDDILEWTTVTLVSDDPAKGLGRADGAGLLIGRLPGLLSQPVESVDLVSAYLIPGSRGTALLESYAAAGVRTRIVTNSLEATDVPIVHSGWMRYRERLVRAGAEVLELRARPDHDDGASPARLLTGSQSSLHAKTFAVDGQRIFIGSFNFDPRSAMLNTEMGFLIESPLIAGALGRSLDGARTFYRVVAAPDGGLNWIERRADGGTVVHSAEPNTSAMQRVMVLVLGWLPVEWML